MRESATIDKTQLPADTYEGWLKKQGVPPGKPPKRVAHPNDSYEEWLGRRVQEGAKRRPDDHKGALA